MGPPIDLLGRWTKRGDKLHLHLDEYLEGLWDEPLVCEPTPDGLAVYRFGLHVQTLRRVVD